MDNELFSNARPDGNPDARCPELVESPPNSRIGGFAHDRDLDNGKEEWLTPPDIIKALGDFELDPCASTPETRPWDTARLHYCYRDNGLIKPWKGRVWLNPPYGTETGKWMARAAAHGNVTALIFARTETAQFFESIWPKAKAVAFLKGRLSFYEHTCRLCGKGISTHKKDKPGYHIPIKTNKAIKGGASGAPSMLVTWDDYNANLLWDAVQHGRINGCYIDLRGGRIAP